MIPIEEQISILKGTYNFIEPSLLDSMINSEENSIVLLDLRDRIEYEKFHLSGAENVSIQDLVDENYMNKMIERGKTVILYSQDNTASNSAFNLMNALSQSEILILNGGVSSYSQNSDTLKLYGPMEAKYDYGLVFNEAKSKAESAFKTPETPRVKPTLRPIKKRKKVEEEEEGCS